MLIKANKTAYFTHFGKKIILKYILLKKSQMTFVGFSKQNKVENLFSFSLLWNVPFFLVKKLSRKDRGASDFKLVEFHGCENSKQPMNTLNSVKNFEIQM